MGTSFAARPAAGMPALAHTRWHEHPWHLCHPRRAIIVIDARGPFCTRVLTLRIEKALRRFRKASNAVGHLRILRNKKTFESSHEKQKRKDKEAVMRMARARRAARSKAAAGF